jgi:hypothetical protein
VPRAPRPAGRRGRDEPIAGGGEEGWEVAHASALGSGPLMGRMLAS